MLQVAWSEHALVNTVNTKRWWIKATTQMWDRWVKATPVSPPWPGGSLHVGQLWSDCKSKMCLTVLLFDPVRFHRCGSCVSPLRSQVSSVLVSLDAPFHLKLLFVSMCAIRWEKQSDRGLSRRVWSEHYWRRRRHRWVSPSCLTCAGSPAGSNTGLTSLPWKQLLMSQRGRFHLNTGLCHQAWDWSTYLLTQQPASKACHSVSWAKWNILL